MIETPCSDPANDPNDWFIEKDGKQYRDDEILTTEEHDAALEGVDIEDVDEALDAAEAEKVRVMLIRRRKARDACYECPIRTACLDQRLTNKIEFGIWGGYYPDELRKIEEEREARLRRRAGVH